MSEFIKCPTLLHVNFVLKIFEIMNFVIELSTSCRQEIIVLYSLRRPLARKNRSKKNEMPHHSRQPHARTLPHLITLLVLLNKLPSLILTPCTIGQNTEKLLCPGYRAGANFPANRATVVDDRAIIIPGKSEL
jgi:hypothetical protein